MYKVVYIVTERVPYEGENIIAAFSSFVEAVACIPIKLSPRPTWPLDEYEKGLFPFKMKMRWVAGTNRKQENNWLIYEADIH